MKISMIVGIGKNREIGCDGRLLWHVGEDLKRFKSITMGHHLLMGRKTFESIGKPLPGRTTIILSHQQNYKATGCFVVSSYEAAKELAQQRGEKELFIIGGGEIYQQLLSQVDMLYLSRIDHAERADTFFPEFEHYTWCKEVEQNFPAQGEDPAWSFQILRRIYD